MAKLRDDLAAWQESFVNLLMLPPDISDHAHHDRTLELTTEEKRCQQVVSSITPARNVLVTGVRRSRLRLSSTCSRVSARPSRAGPPAATGLAVRAIASFIQVDLADPDSIDAAIEQAPARLDVLVNNAGVADTFPPRVVIAVNYLALRRCRRS